MVDLVSANLVQFASITVGAMALAEWATIPIGIPARAQASTPRGRHGTRKPLNCLLWSGLLGGAMLYAELLTPPSADVGPAIAFVVGMSVVSTAIAFGIVQLKKKAIPK